MVYSESDAAGRNIATQLKKITAFSPFSGLPESYPPGLLRHDDLLLFGVKGRLIEMGMDVAKSLPPIDWLLCLSRHASASGKGCLTAHTPGNLTSSAELGGNPEEVAISNPPLQSSLIRALGNCAAELGIDCQITLEATHHGPTCLPYPVTFVEIGSDDAAWNDETLGKAVAEAVHRAASRPLGEFRNALGVGGGHYPEKFTKLVLEGGCQVGHIVPKYAMAGGMRETMFSSCVRRTAGGCSSVFVDWKGTPSVFKDKLKAVSESLGLELVKV